MDSSTKQAWYSMLTLDSFAHVISTSLFHPFVAWIIPLSFRAVLVSYSDRRFIISSVWAALMTARFIFNVFSHRIAYGLPRDLDWEEEVVVITGGASGLGLVLAETYGMRGASVAVLDVADVENAEDRGIVAYKCDVGNREEVQRVAKMIEKDVRVQQNTRHMGVQGRPKRCCFPGLPFACPPSIMMMSFETNA